MPQPWESQPPHDHHADVIDLQSKWPLLATLILAVGVFLGIARLDDGAQAAYDLEVKGLTRGPFLDRDGRPLVYTMRVGNGSSRAYTLPDLEPVVGYQDPEGKWHGLEARYSSFLDASRVRQDWRTFFLHLRGEPARGGRVRLTIDPVVQRAADQALGKNQGAIVALDPRTGAVLALVSKPTCSPAELATVQGFDACRRRPNEPLMDRALQLRLPPGSSFKIVTLTAAMDTGRFHLTDVFSGANVWGPSPYFDNSLYPSNVTRADLTQLTLLQALAFSDNFTFAHIGLTLGGPTILKYAHRYYIGQRIPFVYPVAASSIANGHANPTLAEVAQSAFGAAVDQVTPLQMALIAETVANHGLMMAPHLVQDLEGPDGTMIERYPVHGLRRVMSAAAADEVTTGMVFVVDHGSGFNAQISGMKVAGKTGTAVSGTDRAHAWFITFAPANHPVVAVAVLHEFSGEGFEYAAPLARDVLIAALQRDGYRVR